MVSGTSLGPGRVNRGHRPAERGAEPGNREHHDGHDDGPGRQGHQQECDIVDHSSPDDPRTDSYLLRDPVGRRGGHGESEATDAKLEASSVTTAVRGRARRVTSEPKKESVWPVQNRRKSGCRHGFNSWPHYPVARGLRPGRRGDAVSRCNERKEIRHPQPVQEPTHQPGQARTGFVRADEPGGGQRDDFPSSL